MNKLSETAYTTRLDVAAEKGWVDLFRVIAEAFSIRDPIKHVSLVAALPRLREIGYDHGAINAIESLLDNLNPRETTNGQ